jgi:hypothetical protein
MRRLIILEILTVLLFPTMFFPQSVFCIDIDSLTEDKPINKMNCLNIEPGMRELNKGCDEFNMEVGSILTIKKEDLFNTIRDGIKNTNNPNEANLAFGSNSNVASEVPKYSINGQDYYECDIFASIFANSYGIKEDSDKKNTYYVCGSFARITKLLATFYEEKRKNPNASPDEFINTLKAWKSGEDMYINEYVHKESPNTIKALLAFVKDYDKFIESIIPEYNKKKDHFEKNQQKLVASQEAEKKQKNENQKQNEILRVKNLSKKWANSGFPKEMLTAPLRTYAGATSSGDLCSLVEVIDKISGIQKCNKNGEVWMCSQKKNDDMTGKRNDIKYAFYDMRKTKGYVWLERVVINGEDFPSNQLYYLVIKLLGSSN